MDAAPPLKQPPPPTDPAGFSRSAQMATAFLLGLAVALLAVHVSDYHQGKTRPTEVEDIAPSRIRGQDADDDPLPYAPPSSATASAKPSSKKETLLQGVIDINSATVEELQTLPGIGPKLSQAIIETRSLGRFQSVEDLRRVRGIGVKTLDRMRPHVTVGEPARPLVRSTSSNGTD